MGRQCINIFRYQSGADNTSNPEGNGSTTSVYVAYSTSYNGSGVFQEHWLAFEVDLDELWGDIPGEWKVSSRFGFVSRALQHSRQ